MRTLVNDEQSEAWNGGEGEHRAQDPGFYNGMLDGFNDALFEAAGIARDSAVLDVGCGTGRTALLAALRAPRGRVLGVDLSAPMLERARADARAAGLTGRVTFEQGDAQVHPWGEGGFDVAISRGGVMFFADLVAGFAHIREALAPGGRFAAGLCGMGVVRRALQDLAPAARDRLRAELTDGLEPFVRDGAVRIPGTVRLVTAQA